MIEVESTKRSDSPHGLVARIIYDEDIGPFSPRKCDGNVWTILTNTRSNAGEMDDTIDLNRFCDERDLTEALREEWDAHLIVPIRYESHGPQGRFVAGDLTKPRELFEGTWSFDAIAVVSKETLKKAGIRRHKRALTELVGELHDYSTWHNGDVYEVVIEDRFGEIVESVCDIYELDYAKERAKEELEFAESLAVKEDKRIAYWAARDVVTLTPATRSVAAGWQS